MGGLVPAGHPAIEYTKSLGVLPARDQHAQLCMLVPGKDLLPPVIGRPSSPGLPLQQGLTP